MHASKLMILDEPTAALGVHQTQSTLEVVRSVARRGIAVMVISHSMEDVFAVSDRIVVLRLGRIVLDTPTADTTPDAVVDTSPAASWGAGHEQQRRGDVPVLAPREGLRAQLLQSPGSAAGAGGRRARRGRRVFIATGLHSSLFWGVNNLKVLGEGHWRSSPSRASALDPDHHRLRRPLDRLAARPHRDPHGDAGQRRPLPLRSSSGR